MIRQVVYTEFTERKKGICTVMFFKGIEMCIFRWERVIINVLLLYMAAIC